MSVASNAADNKPLSLWQADLFLEAGVWFASGVTKTDREISGKRPSRCRTDTEDGLGKDCGTKNILFKSEPELFQGPTPPRIPGGGSSAGRLLTHSPSRSESAESPSRVSPG